MVICLTLTQHLPACFAEHVNLTNSTVGSTDASIFGRITDENNKGLPNATINVRNEATGFHTGTLSWVGYHDRKRTGFNFKLINPECGGWHYMINEELYDIENFDPATRQIQYSVRTNDDERRYEVDGFKLMMGLKYSFYT